MSSFFPLPLHAHSFFIGPTVINIYSFRILLLLNLNAQAPGPKSD